MSNYDYYGLTGEEAEELDAIEKAFDANTITQSPELEKRKKELQRIARNTLNKTRNINIRLSERDLYKLKVKAIEEGIPYQTLAASILHKAADK